MKTFFLIVLLSGVLQLYSDPISIPPELGSSECGYVYAKDLPSDYPCISDVTFRKFCDHVVCCTVDSVDPDTVMLGDTIYVADWYMRWFLKNVHPKIRNQYILVSGDSDELHPCHYQQEGQILYDPKIGAWFCRNLVLSNHPKLFVIPIGVTAMAWWFPKETFLDIAAKSSFENKLDFPLVYSCFKAENNIVRAYLDRLFFDNPLVYKEEGAARLSFWNTLAKFKFVLAPSGQVIDSPRFWEALSLNTIPIYEHSPLDALYEGTPSLLVNSWEEITKEFLEESFSKIQKELLDGTLSNEKLWFDYWANKINEIKTLIKDSRWDGGHLEAASFDDESIKNLGEILYDTSIAGDLPEKCVFIMYGKCLGLRALQLSKTFNRFKKIIATDEFAVGDLEHKVLLESMIKDQSLWLFSNNWVEFVPDHMRYPNYIRWQRVKMFFDLTHYRHKFTDALWWFYQSMAHHSVICGNMADDPYVRQQLHELSVRHSIPIDIKGNFWSLRRAHNLKLTFYGPLPFP